MLRKKTLRLLLYDYRWTARYYTIYGTFKSWSSDDFTTISRLFCYDYSRSCYDYFSRNATTIADLYWLSGESPKRDTAVAVNGSAPPAAGLPAGWRVPGCPLCPGQPLTRCQSSSRRVCMVCGMLRRLAWINNSGTPLHPYIPYYNRWSVLTCAASGVAVVSGIGVERLGACVRSSVAQAVL